MQRQTQNIMVPEGPELTAEQLEMVESQFKVSVLDGKLKNRFQFVAVKRGTSVLSINFLYHVTFEDLEWS